MPFTLFHLGNWIERRWHIALCALGLALLAAGSAQAQAPDQAPPAVLLAAARDDAPRQAQPRGVFEQRTLVVALGSARVRLASTPDGTGELCTDDRATLTLAPATGAPVYWEHQFARSDHRAIECAEPQTLTLPAGPGSYTATLTLEDLYPDTFSTRAYYLVPELPPGAVAAGAEQSVPSSPPPTVPIPTRAVLATIQPIAAPPAAAPVASPAPAAQPVAAQSVEQPASAAMLSDPRAVALLGAAAALALLAIVLVFRRRRAPAPQLGGVLYLFEPASREARAIALQACATAIEIRRRPLDAVPANTAGGAVAIGRIQATPGGPALVDLGAPATPPVVLEHDRPYSLAGGAVTLRYRPEGTRLPSPSVPARGARSSMTRRKG